MAQGGETAGGGEPADFWVIATLIDGLAASLDWSPVHDNYQWKAWYGSRPIDPPSLRVIGTCRLPRPGWTMRLTPHEPPGINPEDRLVDCVMEVPVGDPDADPNVKYEEVTDHSYQTVTLFPGGPTIPVNPLG